MIIVSPYYIRDEIVSRYSFHIIFFKILKCSFDVKDINADFLRDN